MRKTFWIILLIVMLIGGTGYVGAKYFNNFNGLFSNGNCQSDCGESGRRVR
jgi:hypothetical protein